jgi:hypothetical protein
MMAYKFTPSRPASASANWLDYNLQVHLHAATAGLLINRGNGGR